MQYDLLTTGNGSITTSAFLPTIKVVTTTARFKLLKTTWTSTLAAISTAFRWTICKEASSGRCGIGLSVGSGGHALVQLGQLEQTARKPEAVTVVQQLVAFHSAFNLPIGKRPISISLINCFTAIHGADRTHPAHQLMPADWTTAAAAQSFEDGHGISRFVALALYRRLRCLSSPERLYPYHAWLPDAPDGWAGALGAWLRGDNDFMAEELKKNGCR